MLMLERTLFCFKTRNVPSLQCPVLASEVENEILHQSAAAVAATFVLVLPQAAFHHGFPFFSSASSNPYSHEHPAVKKTKERERPSNPKNKKYSPVVLSIFCCCRSFGTCLLSGSCGTSRSRAQFTSTRPVSVARRRPCQQHVLCFTPPPKVLSRRFPSLCCVSVCC